MSTRLDDIACPVAACVRWRESYGHGRIYRRDDGSVRCEGCGGEIRAGVWHWQCKVCHAVLEPGALKGFFVPTRCEACDAALVAEQKAKGQVCSGCRSVFAYCCC